ncbi:hypothetical protein CKAH01_12472 [Colletotrichum kahawae]|uniref:Uncharacterized protein n=1 Tax=Colletotrichum kahawae TaxID=34407 RepID=A0AAD9YTC2_COLKA|nr:hypothetical protein CKAH01_12472 [Colletotrichum kahawae]
MDDGPRTTYVCRACAINPGCSTDFDDTENPSPEMMFAKPSILTQGSTDWDGAEGYRFYFGVSSPTRPTGRRQIAISRAAICTGARMHAQQLPRLDTVAAFWNAGSGRAVRLPGTMPEAPKTNPTAPVAAAA